MKKHKHKFTIGSLHQDMLSPHAKFFNDYDFAYVICYECGAVKQVRVEKEK